MGLYPNMEQTISSKIWTFHWTIVCWKYLNQNSNPWHTVRMFPWLRYWNYFDFPAVRRHFYCVVYFTDKRCKQRYVTFPADTLGTIGTKSPVSDYIYIHMFNMRNNQILRKTCLCVFYIQTVLFLMWSDYMCHLKCLDNNDQHCVCIHVCFWHVDICGKTLANIIYTD